MMHEIELSLPLEMLEGAGGIERLFLQLSKLERLAEQIQQEWQRRGSELSPEYPPSVQREQVSPTEWRIFLDPTNPKVVGLEQGRAAWDLKRVLATSPRVRRGPGGRYLIIPLRARRDKAAGDHEWGGLGRAVTFRTLSESSPADSWIIPERPGAHLAEAVLEWARGQVDDWMAGA